MTFSLTEALLASDADGFQRATQSVFLQSAAQGTVDKATLGQWLANDRLYILAYIQGIGKTLSVLPLPQTIPDHPPNDGGTATTKLLDWLIDAMVNIRREEKFFVDTASRFGISVNLPSDVDGHVADSEKLEGLRRFESIFCGLGLGLGPSKSTRSSLLPWLECAVVFYATEKCYLEAWTWAAGRSDLEGRSDGGCSGDADGGALRREFIPNWTGAEFAAFVDRLGRIIDDAVKEELRDNGESVKTELVDRALVKWREVLAAEEAFWPVMQFSS
ncbi:hypothetical protein QQS21_007791 [Conoideocrella luteorostrata]|uniref:Heme oxygenase-like protein n=1 Tax=Conoideocrella luteorostrata TaxID=1105319 RepID=A0AAJ0FZ70_9HYPO|nr:hypothetical protein QQS21_007791 [Conoideocrella luteorostrata]